MAVCLIDSFQALWHKMFGVLIFCKMPLLFFCAPKIEHMFLFFMKIASIDGWRTLFNVQNSDE